MSLAFRWNCLPNELIACIFEQLPQHDRLALRLCCRAWRDGMDPLVFHTLVLRSSMDELDPLHYSHLDDAQKKKIFQGFRTAWVDYAAAAATGTATTTAVSPSCQRLGRFVRHVAVRTRYLDPEDIAALLQHCPGVKSIEIEAAVLREFNLRLMQGFNVDLRPILDDDDENDAQLDTSNDDNDNDNDGDDDHQGGDMVLSHRLVRKLQPIFAGKESVEICAFVPTRAFCAAILPHLASVRELKVTRHRRWWRGWTEGPPLFFNDLRELASMPKKCPRLTSLAFTTCITPPFGDSFVSPAFLQSRHRPGRHPGCDACMHPWPAITSLAIDVYHNKEDVLDVPGLIAYICLKFPNVRALTLWTSRINGDTWDNVVRDASWKTLLDLPVAYLPSLSSVTLSKAFSAIALDVLHFFTTSRRAGRGAPVMSLQLTGNELIWQFSLDVLRILSLFPHLRSLDPGQAHLVASRDPHEPMQSTTLGYSLPIPSNHPLQKLYYYNSAMQAGKSDLSLHRLAEICPDLVLVCKK